MHRSTPPRRATALNSHPLEEISNTTIAFNSSVNERFNNHTTSPSDTLADSGLRAEPVLENGIIANSQLNVASGNSNIPDGIYAPIDSETYSADGQAERRNGDIIENGIRRAPVRSNTTLDDVSSVSVSDLRLGPANRETLATLALLTQYPEDEPRRAAPEEVPTVSRLATPLWHHDSGPWLENEQADLGDGRAPARSATAIRSWSTDTMPPFGPASQHQDRSVRDANASHGNMSDSRVGDTTPRDEGRAIILGGYVLGTSPSAENREAWAGGPAAASENAMNSGSNTENIRLNTRITLSDLTGQQDTAHLNAVGHIPNRDPSPTASIPDNTPDGGSSTYLTDRVEELSTEVSERWTCALTPAPVNGNTRPHLPNVSTVNDHQSHASSAVNRNVGNRDRRAPRTVGSLRRMSAGENEAFWDEFDDSRND